MVLRHLHFSHRLFKCVHLSISPLFTLASKLTQKVMKHLISLTSSTRDPCYLGQLVKKAIFPLPSHKFNLGDATGCDI